MTQLGGYIKSCPRTKFEGIRIKTADACAREVNILLLTVTELEKLRFSRKVTVDETVKRDVITGLRNELKITIVQTSTSGSYVSCGATKKIINLAENIKFIYKIGTAAGNFD